MKKKNKTNTTKINRHKKANLLFPIIGGVALVGGAAAGIAVGVTHLPVVKAEENTLYVDPNSNEATLTLDLKEDVEGNKVDLTIETEVENGEDEKPQVVFKDGGVTQRDVDVIENKVVTYVKLVNPPRLAREYTYEFSITMNYTNTKGKNVERVVKNLKLVYECSDIIDNTNVEKTATAKWEKQSDTLYTTVFRYTGFIYNGFDIPPQINITSDLPDWIKAEAQPTNFGKDAGEGNKTFDIEVSMSSTIIPDEGGTLIFEFVDQSTKEIIPLKNPLSTEYWFVTEVAPTDITVSFEGGVSTINPGEEIQATAVTNPIGLGGVTWKSGDEDVATVSDSGLVTGVGAGQTVIIASSDIDPSVQGMATITVKSEAPTAVTIYINGEPASETLDITVADQPTINAVVTYSGEEGDKSVSWISSDPSVAEVTEDPITKDPVFEIKKQGTTVIAAASKVDPTVNDSLTVHVDPTVTEITCDIEGELSYILAINDDSIFANASVNEGAAIPTDLEWSVEGDDGVINFDDTTHEITGLDLGVVSVQAKSDTYPDAVITPAEVRVTEVYEVDIAINSTKLFVNQTTQAQVTNIESDDQLDNEFMANEWVSSNPTVASIDENGLITAHTAGTTNIHAVRGGVSSNSITIYVDPIPTKVNVSIDRTDLTLAGDFHTAKATATVEPIGASQDVIWEVTSGSDYIGVSQDGTITAKAVGQGKIRAKAKGTTTISSENTITVHPTADSIDFTLPESIQAGETITVNATVSGEGCLTDVVWTPGSSSVEITKKDEDTCTITAKSSISTSQDVSITATNCDGKSITHSLSVKPAPVAPTEIHITGLSPSINIGDTPQATVTYSATGDKGFEVVSSAPSVVSIGSTITDTTFTIKGESKGAAAITVKSKYNQSVSDTFVVTVTDVYPTEATMDVGSGQLTIGGESITATLKSGTSSLDPTLISGVEWKSSDTNVATVEGSTAAASLHQATISAGSTEGTATITATIYLKNGTVIKNVSSSVTVTSSLEDVYIKITGSVVPSPYQETYEALVGSDITFEAFSDTSMTVPTNVTWTFDLADVTASFTYLVAPTPTKCSIRLTSFGNLDIKATSIEKPTESSRLIMPITVRDQITQVITDTEAGVEENPTIISQTIYYPLEGSHIWGLKINNLSDHKDWLTKINEETGDLELKFGGLIKITNGSTTAAINGSTIGLNINGTPYQCNINNNAIKLTAEVKNVLIGLFTSGGEISISCAIYWNTNVDGSFYIELS